MASYRWNNLAVTIEKQGHVRIGGKGDPMRMGRYSEIRTRDYEFQFTLNGEIRFIRGLGIDWPHPYECLKRTDGNDWIYYSVSAVQNLIDLTGGYYLPCLPYPSNSIWPHNPYADPGVLKAMGAWSSLDADLRGGSSLSLPADLKDFFDVVTRTDDHALFRRSQELHDIVGGPITVLPPDTRYVDYQVIPLTIADGCRYHCSFCCVKSPEGFHCRSREEICRQIRRLKKFYGPNLTNYRSLFLGSHDALGAGFDLICTAAEEAGAALGLTSAEGAPPRLFLFASADALLNTPAGGFERIDSLPFSTHINIGLESVDAQTLQQIGKPLTPEKVRTAFERMTQLNRELANLEITANFLVGDPLSEAHHGTLADLLQSVASGAPAQSPRAGGKGTVYLSPLMGRQDSFALTHRFYRIKRQSQWPTYLYLIQRL